MIYYLGPPGLTPDGFEVCTMEDIVKYCSQQAVLGVDTETEGLDFLSKKLIMFQIGNQHNQYVIDTRIYSIEALRDILESRTVLKIFHNVKFDYKFIKQWADITCENIYDTMIAEKVIHCGRQNKSYSLTSLTEYYCGVALDKEIRNKFVGMTGEPFTKYQVVYGAQDVVYLPLIRDDQMIQINNHSLENTLKLENDVALSFADIEFNGIDIDLQKWDEIADISGEEAFRILDKLDAYIENDVLFESFRSKSIQTDLFMPVEELRRVDVKWTSPTQVLKVFKTLIADLEDVNGKNLYKHAYSNPIIKDYIEFKEKMKLFTSYGREFFKFVKSDGKVHTSFNQILNTGRVSSNSPNMQQIPSDNKYRNCFITPGEGWVFVSSDYSSQELCIIAEGAKDPVWLKALNAGEDLHSICAELVYGEEWKNAADDNCAFYLHNKQKCNCKAHKSLRTNVKTINFGLAYGMSAMKLSETLQITFQAAEQLIDKYFKAFPAINKFLKALGNYGKHFGHIKTYSPFSRIRWFDDWSPRLKYQKTSMKTLGRIERASKNTPIQGTGADMTKKALILIREEIQRNWKDKVKLVMTVHDQIDTICAKECANEWANKMTGLMEDAAKEILPSGLLKADTNITSCWEK